MKSGWVTKKLGEVCELKTGYTPKKSVLTDVGDIPYYRVSAMNLPENMVTLKTPNGWLRGEWRTFKKGSIVFPKNGGAAYTGKVRILSCDSVVDLNTGICLPTYEVYYYYLYYWFHSLDIKSVIVEGTIPFIDFGKMAELHIPIPSLSEQKRIVAKIDAAFEKIDSLKANAEKNLANAKELFQSALDEAMRPKTGWIERRLGEVYEITSSKRVFKSEWKTSGIPFYRAREIVKLAANGFVKNELFVSDEMYKAYAMKYGITKAGDIMITGVGTLGVCYVVKGDDKFYFKDGNIIWLKKCSEEVDSEFISLAFSTTPVRKQVLANAGTTVGTYTIIMAKNTVVQMPNGVEQRRIVNYVYGLRKKLETLQQNYARQIADCAEMRQAILREAFEGRL